MAPQSPRSHRSAAPRRPAGSVRLWCNRLEDRVTPAVFNAQPALTQWGTNMNNNGFVATADFNKDGYMDAVLTNFGTSMSDVSGNNVQVLYGQPGGGFFRFQFNTGGTNVSFAN